MGGGVGHVPPWAPCSYVTAWYIKYTLYVAIL